MKQCTKCGEVLDLSFFYKRKDSPDGYRNACKKCQCAQVSKQRAENFEHYQQYELNRRELPHRKELRAKIAKKRMQDPLRKGAANAVRVEIDAGRMAPASACICEDCREKPAEHLHHHSYEREHWLDVIPLCARCHSIRHR